MHILDELLYQAGMGLAACPTAAGHEHFVRDYLVEQLRGLPHVRVRQDEYGNLIARYRHKARGREPVRIVAHMDHPAFAEGVTIGTDFTSEAKRLRLAQPIPAAATFATWDLPAADCTKRLFVSPACDDLAQAATMLALLQRLAEAHAPANVEALFTRAEEIGFYGTFAALKSRTPLDPMVTLSLETSNGRGYARLDDGPIVRVGDRLSIFDSRVTHWLETAFRDLKTRQPRTAWQRLLMGGGACEATVFHRAGFPTGALCVAMNAYHNMGSGDSLRRESISLRDWQGLYDFLFFLTTEAAPLAAVDGAVGARLAGLEKKALQMLREP